ncbi:MAG: hypothetical protein IJA17_03420, partial [Oscillospiraceae bacterium]|nr:hypothetical protein [Oscillospiraceae bacterium]
RKIQKIFWGRGAASERLRNTAKRCSENSELCRDEREQTAGVGKRFFGGYHRFFAPSKKWGYISNENGGFFRTVRTVPYGCPVIKKRADDIRPYGNHDDTRRQQKPPLTRGLF